MAGALISGMVSLLSKPGLIPVGLEEEGQKLLDQFSKKIQPVLAYAETRADDETVMKWLTDLNAATCDADDLLDELNYEKLCAEAENDGRAADGVSTGLLSLCKISSRKKNTFQNEIRSKLKKVGERMDNIVKSMGDFDFEKGVKEGVDGVAFAGEEFEFIEPEEVVVGREKEMFEIWLDMQEWGRVDGMVSTRTDYQVNDKEWGPRLILEGELWYMEKSRALLDEGGKMKMSRTARVISIVGVGGSGRKTLAQSVFKTAKKNYLLDLLLWIDMGEEMRSVANIFKCLIDQAIGKDCCLSEADMDLLQRRLRQELNGRRYLVVLNNVRESSSWTRLKSLLNHGWGVTIVITHSLEIAHNLDSDFISKLSYLNKEDSWKLFCKSAFTTGKSKYPEVLEIGKYFISVCEGVPLRLNMLGSLMRFKKEPAEWREVLHQLDKGENVSNTTIIWICYNHLPSNIKKCFAFSSIFPKGHDMDKDIMIKLWIANGLIDSDGSTNPEAKGDLIFKELVMRYFFQDVKHVHRDVFGNNHEYHGRVVFKVLEPIHDFARLVAPHVRSYNSELNQSMKQKETIHHVSITGDSTLDIAMAIKAWPNARSILSPVESLGRAVECDDFPKPNSLRALHVRSSLFLQEDLSELKHMKHLRYLDLSGSRIKTLPEATSTLYCMQTLNLSKCLLLCQLPKGMRYMRSLRHLSVDRCPRLKKMPAHLGKLNCLQTLTTYIIGEDDGYRIGEIKDLHLGGLLELYNLRKVKFAAEAKEVNLYAKRDLESLSLCWGGQQYIASKATNDFHVLEALRPNVGLKVLKIQQYGDPEFADWLANPVLNNLVELHLILCTELKTVPSVWHLPSLRVLSLKYMNSLSYIYGSSSLPGEGSEGSTKLFRALKRLVLIGMKSLKEWQKGEAEGKVVHGTMLNFPVLDEMEIINCPKLETMPTAPCLKHLTIRIENPILLQSVADLISRSSNLVEANITNTESANSELLVTTEMKVDEHNECSLRRLRLDSTNSLFMSRKLRHIFLPRRLLVSQLSFWRSFGSLEYLDIFNCGDLVAWPKEELSGLIRLRRLSIRVCKHLTGSSAEPSSELNLHQLESLEIYGCPLLAEIPKCSSSLKDLELDECPKITSISGNGWMVDLETLYISCTSWPSLPSGWEQLTKLNSLRITECYSLTNLPNEMAALTSLNTLIINDCPRLKLRSPKHPDLDKMLSHLELLKVSKCADVDNFSGKRSSRYNNPSSSS